MNIEVIYMDDRKGCVDEALLDDMLEKNMIKMFRRSDGWAMSGVDETRGYSRILWSSLVLYTGPDRRSQSGRIVDDCSYFRYAA